MLEVRWHGRGGQGAFTAARLLGIASALFEQRFALAFPSFGPERRGAPVLGFTRIDDRKITDRTLPTECDYVVVLDETLAGPNIAVGLKSGAKLILNTAHPERYRALAPDHEIIGLDATTLALEVLGSPITNTAMLGALVAVSGIVRLESAIQAISHELKPRIAQKNIDLLRRVEALVAGARP